MTNPRQVVVSGVLLGIGLGGFIDGIVFHQLLQVHNMLSATYPTQGLPADQLVVNLEVNMFWDGMFHAFTWLMTALGLMLLWDVLNNSPKPYANGLLIGSLLLGWGLFNFVEGLLNHHILHLHHVIESVNHFPWDVSFLASGIVFSTLGYWLIRRGLRSNKNATATNTVAS
jgi:uncharacterized membrane protein